MPNLDQQITELAKVRKSLTDKRAEVTAIEQSEAVLVTRIQAATEQLIRDETAKIRQPVDKAELDDIIDRNKR